MNKNDYNALQNRGEELIGAITFHAEELKISKDNFYKKDSASPKQSLQLDKFQKVVFSIGAVAYVLLFLLGFLPDSLYAFLFTTVFYSMVVYTLSSRLKHSNKILSIYTISIVKFVFYIISFISLSVLIIYAFVSDDVPSGIKFVLGSLLALLYVYDKLMGEPEKPKERLTVRQQIDKEEMERWQQIIDYNKRRDEAYRDRLYAKGIEEQARRNS